MIVDTNALSAFFAGDNNIRRFFESIEEFFMPIIVLGEYLYGLRFSAKRKFLENLLYGFLEDVQVLEINQSIAEEYSLIRAELREAGTPIPENDIWIGASARSLGLPVLSNDGHFLKIRNLTVHRW